MVVPDTILFDAVITDMVLSMSRRRRSGGPSGPGWPAGRRGTWPARSSDGTKGLDDRVSDECSAMMTVSGGGAALGTSR